MPTRNHTLFSQGDVKCEVKVKYKEGSQREKEHDRNTNVNWRDGIYMKLIQMETEKNECKRITSEVLTDGEEGSEVEEEIKSKTTSLSRQESVVQE